MSPQLLTVIPTLDTSAYATGDYIAKVECAGFFSGLGRAAILQSLVIVDQAKQKAALDILFFNADPTVASAVNAAIDITDAEMIAKCIGSLSVVTGDYITDLAASSLATQKNLNLLLDASDTSQSLWLVLVSRGSPTYAASSLSIKLGAVRY
jgi:hypothetical protein